MRNRHCTLKLDYLLAALPVIVFFFLPGAAVLAKSTLVSERLSDTRAGVAGLFSSPQTSAIVSNASGELPLGGTTRVFPVNVSNVQNLGAATVMVAYDPALVVPVNCQRNPVFPSGLCNWQDEPSERCPASTVCFNVLASFDEAVSVAADAQLPMVSITWQATGMASLSSSTTLSVTVDTFADAQSIAMPVSAQNGVITFVAAPTATPTATPTSTATATPTPTATTAPTATSTATVTPQPTVANRSSIYLPSINAP